MTKNITPATIDAAIAALTEALRQAAPDTVALVCQVCANALHESATGDAVGLSLSHSAQVAATAAMREHPLPDSRWATTCLGTPGKLAQEYAERALCPEWQTA